MKWFFWQIFCAANIRASFISMFCDFSFLLLMILNSNGCFMNLIIFRIVFGWMRRKTNVKKLMCSHLFLFLSILFLLSEFLLSVNIICTLTSWSFCRKLIDQFLAFVSRFMVWGWTIWNVSIFIYLQCRQWLGWMIRISR